MNLTKADFANKLASTLDLSKQDSKLLVDNFFTVISDALVQGEEVRISGFGNFNLRDKPARPGCNPRTGEVVTIAERRVVTFKQGQKLKDSINGFAAIALEE